MAFQPSPVVVAAADNPGMYWEISYFKPEGKPGRFVAVEGIAKPIEGDAGYTFQYDPFGCRRVVKQLEGRASKAKLQAAYRALVADMREQGQLPPRPQG
jgi:hypothetical protein